MRAARATKPRKGNNTMRCISPLKSNLDRLGNRTYNNTKAEPGLIGVQFECRKCLPCRLNISVEKSVRVMHEAKIYGDNNIFLTLTYEEQNLSSPKLQYKEFQDFMRELRRKTKRTIPYMVTGEYGEIEKRPHWHAILFNYKPSDGEHHYTNKRGDKVFTSKFINSIWKKGHADYGSVTKESAAYVGRYAAKKLVHGKDQEHDYHPIHKTSSKHAIGKKWIEKNWKHTFENGFVLDTNYQPQKIPRYYIDWMKKEHPNEYSHYVMNVRENIIEKATSRARKEELEHLSMLMNREGGTAYPKSRNQVKLTILKSKFKNLLGVNKL